MSELGASTVERAAVFFPHARLEELAAGGRVELDGARLALGSVLYTVAEAVRVLPAMAVGVDARGLCGEVRTRAELTDTLGAELLGDSMLLDDAAYEVVSGLLAEPEGPLDEAAGAIGERAWLASL